MTSPMTASICSRKLSKVGLQCRHVAIRYEDTPGELYVLDQDKTLSEVISNICNKFGIASPEEHALRFNRPQKPVFITEENRFEIQDAHILTLTLTTEKLSQRICRCLQSGDARERSDALGHLLELAEDVTFARDFVSQNGLHLLMCIAVIGESSCVAQSLTTILRSIMMLVNITSTSWDVMEHRFLKMMMTTVKTKCTAIGDSALEAVLDTLHAVISNSEVHYETVEQALRLEILVEHLKASTNSTKDANAPANQRSYNRTIQTKVLILINTLLAEAERARKEKMIVYLQSKEVRIILMMNVLSYRPPGEIEPELVHQLARLQSALFTELSERRMLRPATDNQNLEGHIRKLRIIAFGLDSRLHLPDGVTPTEALLSEHEYRKIGFQNIQNPLADFQQVPPGRLALDNVIHFANVYKEAYSRVILESSCRDNDTDDDDLNGHDFPFIQASLALTNLLFRVLKLGQPVGEEDMEFQPLLLGQPLPFEELFCDCIQLFCKTWTEMSARSEDFLKVLDAVEEQVTRALQCQPYTFLELRAKLGELSYMSVSQIWRKRRDEDETQIHHLRPVEELKAKITPEVLALIKEQRLRHLVKGSMFEKYAKGHRLKGKYMYGRLSANHKIFHYDDWNDSTPPCYIEELHKQVIIEDIYSLERLCAKEKDKDKGKKAGNSFSLTTRNGDGEETVVFTPIGPTEIDTWMDGLNLLLRNQMCSRLALEEVDSLLTMELKVRLLDLDGVEVPVQPPEMPEPPPNYEYVFE